MSWAHEVQDDPEFADWVNANASGDGELLFGRKTYEMMAAFCPTPMAAQQMPVVAKGMNARKKYVVSRTIRPAWNNSYLLEGDLTSSVRALKAGDGPGIAVLGSGSVAAGSDSGRITAGCANPTAIGETTSFEISNRARLFRPRQRLHRVTRQFRSRLDAAQMKIASSDLPKPVQTQRRP